MRNELIECVSEFDDQLMEDYLEGKEISANKAIPLNTWTHLSYT